MTVHVHKNNAAVTYEDHSHAAPAKLDERTWSFTCQPACEERILHDVEHTARTKTGVPLTVEEEAEKEAISAQAEQDVSKLALALSKLGKEAAAESAA